METLASDLDRRLREVRQQTHLLLGPLTDDQLVRQFDDIMSPPIWDLGHIAAYEELWLVTRLTGKGPLHPERATIYDAAETPRAARGDANLLGPDECRTYLAEVREQSFAALQEADLGADADPLTAEGFVFEMVAEHEAQHTETVLQGLKMLPPGEYRPARSQPTDGRAPAEEDVVALEGGVVEIGAPPGGFAYDCERPRHRQVLAPFALAAAPVSNGQYLAFVEDGGYRRPELWTASGWGWREQNGVEAPHYWQRDGEGGWLERDFEKTEPLDLARAVCHVSAHEADAHARWAGARLPTEGEWEHAASGSTVEGANLGQREFEPRSCGLNDLAGPGCPRQMLGDVWEWTSTDFEAYPGFRAFPYAEYSEVFFGEPYRVLRGGSWATQDHAVRPSFRNWDLPGRRQIFSGLRLAWDA